MATSFAAHILGPDDHASRPAANTVPYGAIYYCTDHDLLYINNAGTWGTYLDNGAAGGGAVATDAIWDAAGDLAVGSGADTAARKAVGSDYQQLRARAGATNGLEWAGGMSLWSEIVAAGGSQASLDFQSIPGTGRHLVIEAMVRGDKAAAYDDCYIRLNNDSGNNYDWQSLGAYATTVFGVTGIAQAQITLGQPAAASGVASAWSHYSIKIPNYASTGFHKVVNAQGAEKTAASSGSIVSRQTIGHWRNTGAVTRVTILFAGGNVEDASVATMYIVS